MKNIAFIGLKHSGKSNHCRRIAQHIGLPSIDLDDCILKAYLDAHTASAEKSVRELYREHGEAWFRQAELSAVQGIVEPHFVLATGGGSMENRALMDELKKQEMLLVFLDVPEDILLERILRKGLPPFLNPEDPQASFHPLYTRRRALALAAADIHIEAENYSKDMIFEIILDRIAGMQQLSPGST